jgi:hypothetical protein
LQALRLQSQASAYLQSLLMHSSLPGIELLVHALYQVLQLCWQARQKLMRIQHQVLQSALKHLQDLPEP